MAMIDESHLFREKKGATLGAKDRELKEKENLAALLPRRVPFHVARIPDNYASLKDKFIPVNGAFLTQTKGGPSSSSSSSSSSPSSSSSTLNGGPSGSSGAEKVEEEEGKLIADMLKWEKVQKIGSGLRNMGNTCFLNSSLQCLTYLPPIVSMANDRTHSSTCLSTSDFCALCAVERHVRRCLTGGSVVAPTQFVKNLKRISRGMRHGRQEDAHEFLHNLKDRMVASCLPSGLPQRLKAEAEKKTPIFQIFGGRLLSRVKCAKCGYNSDTLDPILQLTLEIRGCQTLDQAFKKYCSPEILDHDNQYKCDSCKQKSRAKKQLLIREAPNILTIQLKRFDIFGRKVNKPIGIRERLNIEPYVMKMKGREKHNTHYELCGVLVHWGGSANSGHYYSYVKNSNGVWYEMNDERVKQVGLDRVLKDQSYMLFYVSKNPRKGQKCALGRVGLRKQPSPSPSLSSSLSSSKKQEEKLKSSSSSSLMNGSSSSSSSSSPSSSPSPALPEQKQMEFKWDDSVNNAPGWLEFKEQVDREKKEREEAREGKGKTKNRKRKREGREAEEKKWLTEVHRVRGLKKKNQFGEEIGGWGEEGGVESDVLAFKKGVEGKEHLPSYITQKRDRWEEEYDLGRKKKMRKKEEFVGGEGKKNVFQRIQGLEDPRKSSNGRGRGGFRGRGRGGRGGRGGKFGKKGKKF